MNIFKKMPEGNREKQPPVKNVLLQTYFTSLLSLVLCVTMFLGTTYAWFTSEISNNANEIYIGTLDVGLFKHDGLDGEGKVKWADLASSDANTTKLFDDGIRWEPGYTALETIKIVNEGDLAFKYVMSFTDGAINDQTPQDDAAKQLLNTAAKNFVVYVHTGDYAEGEEKPRDFGQIKSSDKWEPVMLDDQVATLADILEKGLPVLNGNITDVRGAVNTRAAAPGPNDSKPTEQVFIIALHMKKETADANIMGQKISLNVKLTAHQMVSEQDGFGESDYDKYADAVPSYNLNEVKENLNDGNGVLLMDDIVAPTADIMVNGAVFDGNGKNLDINVQNANDAAIGITGGAVCNVAVNTANTSTLGIGIGLNHFSSDKLSEDLTLEGVTVCQNDDIFARNIMYAVYAETENSPRIVVTDSALYGAVDCPGAASFTATNSTFGSGKYWFFAVSGDTTFTNCTFESTYCILAYADSQGKTITFTNCNVAGTKLTADNFKAKLVSDAWDYSSDLCSTNLKDCTIIIDGVTVNWG